MQPCGDPTFIEPIGIVSMPANGAIAVDWPKGSFAVGEKICAWVEPVCMPRRPDRSKRRFFAKRPQLNQSGAAS